MGREAAPDKDAEVGPGRGLPAGQSLQSSRGALSSGASRSGSRKAWAPPGGRRRSTPPPSHRRSAASRTRSRWRVGRRRPKSPRAGNSFSSLPRVLRGWGRAPPPRGCHAAADLGARIAAAKLLLLRTYCTFPQTSYSFLNSFTQEADCSRAALCLSLVLGRSAPASTF